MSDWPTRVDPKIVEDFNATADALGIGKLREHETVINGMLSALRVMSARLVAAEQTIQTIVGSRFNPEVLEDY